MKRRLGVGVGLVVVVLALVLWRCRGDRGAHSAEHQGSGAATDRASTTNAAIGVVPKQKIDPRTLARGSISGTIRDESKKPIAKASVCLSLYSDELPPDLWDESPCKTTDANGFYEWTDLFVARYVVMASARGFRFDYHRPNGPKEKASFKLGPGEHKKNVDVTLKAGGVEITGVVNDISGGPIAQARVRASLGMWGEGGETPPAETDDKGAFSLWVPQGNVRVTARADGYAAGEQRGRAPGTFEILLTPESSLSGIVIDARTEKPIEGADVGVERTQWEGFFNFSKKRTDDKGAFRIDGLSPGRYTAIVEGEKGYGRTEGSTLVGLGQHITGVIVRVHPTTRVIGKVVLAGTKELCKDSGVVLRDEDNDRWVSDSADEDGTITVHGLLPGTYKVQAWCPKKIGRDDYEKVVVVDKDITGLVWEVDEGAIISGKVTGKSGQPIADARIQAQLTGGDARAKEDWNSENTDLDGTYEMTSLKTATYRLEVTSDKGVAERDGYKVETKVGQTTTKDIVLDDGGTLTGTVVDETGKPVPKVTINANAITMTEGVFVFWDQSPNQSDANGAFTITGLRPGDYRVTAARGFFDSLRKPGTTDDAKQGEKTTIEAGKTSTVKLVVEAQSGVIKGIVLDADGKPVSDAFISKARESDAAGAGAARAHGTRGWGWGGDKPVLTAVDGTFTLGELAPGKYTLRAYRKGGGEALVEHVPVGTKNAKLEIKDTGSIEGTVKMASGTLPDEIEVSVEDLKTGFDRTEKFFRSEGRFVMRDLPAGHFHVGASAARGNAKIEIDLANGEQKSGVALTLEELITLTGRVVDFVTKAPVPGIRVYAQIAQGGSFSFRWSDDMDNTSDASGKFTVKKAPRGKLSVQGMPKEWKGADYSMFRIIRDVTASMETTIDIGDIPIMKRRVKHGDPVGEMGLNFKEQPPETPPEEQELRVSFIEPDGPAAKTDIKVGDVIVTVDGIDVTGVNGQHAWGLLSAAPGTKLVLGLERGASVTLTLAPPS
jgi:protocatechuate 3,4-dioxygenase beta subunit